MKIIDDIIRGATVLTMVFGSTMAALSANLFVSPFGSDTSPYDTWGKAATNIITAIAAAQDDDTVWVDVGQYVLTQTVNVNKGITVRGRSLARYSEVNGDGRVRCFEVRHPRATVQSLTITAGSAARGGGVWITNGLVSDCVITGNYAQLFGGGVDIQNSGIVSNCDIAYNRVPINAGANGGGACVQGDGSGGGVLIASTIASNEAAHGGGVYLFDNGLIESCGIVSNRAWDTLGHTGSGGGVECNGSNIVVKNCNIYRNLSQETAGGVYLAGHVGQKVVGCLIYDNETGWYGGGLYANLAPDAYAVENCTIVANRSTNEGLGVGGGVCVGFSGDPLLRNSIVYFNTAPVAGDNYYVSGAGGDITGQNSCTTPAMAGAGNITGNPLFYDMPSGLFQLTADSPCVNAGANQGWMAGARDIAMKTRIINNVVDIGAYEYGVDPDPAPDNRIVFFLQPNDWYDGNAGDDLHVEARAAWFTGITQTVAYVNSNPIWTQAWNGAGYCVIDFIWANVPQGMYTMTIKAWDVNGAMISSAPITLSFEYAFAGLPAADFDGDGLADPALVLNSGEWYVWLSRQNFAFVGPYLNLPGYLPLAADFDGDGLADPVLVNEDTGLWMVFHSGNNYMAQEYLRDTGIPVAADLDGDGRADFAVVGSPNRVNAGEWVVWLSTQNYRRWATPHKTHAYPKEAAGDYDGDGKADPMYITPAGQWYAAFSTHGYTVEMLAGINTGDNLAAAADMDGDGFVDFIMLDDDDVIQALLSSHEYAAWETLELPPIP